MQGSQFAHHLLAPDCQLRIGDGSCQPGPQALAAFVRHSRVEQMVQRPLAGEVEVDFERMLGVWLEVKGRWDLIPRELCPGNLCRLDLEPQAVSLDAALDPAMGIHRNAKEQQPDHSTERREPASRRQDGEANDQRAHAKDSDAHPGIAIAGAIELLHPALQADNLVV